MMAKFLHQKEVILSKMIRAKRNVMKKHTKNRGLLFAFQPTRGAALVLFSLSPAIFLAVTLPEAQCRSHDIKMIAPRAAVAYEKWRRGWVVQIFYSLTVLLPK
jgi:hypothetical protein